MAGFKPSTPFSTALVLLAPEKSNSYGVTTKSFPPIQDGRLFYGSFKTYGGTERDVNGAYSVEDTAVVQTWYNPEITSACRVAIPNTGAVYEIINEPENVNMRNQFMQFKVRRVKGGA